MAKPIQALFVTKRPKLVPALGDNLMPEILLESAITADNLADAFQKHHDTKFKICFIDEAITDGLDAFFQDIATLGRDKECIFVQMRPQMPVEFDRRSLRTMGFHTVISSDITKEDKQELLDNLRLELHMREMEERITDVGEAIQILLREIDAAWKEKKRGRERKISKLLKNFVALHVDFDPQILGRYFEKLTEQSDKATPFDDSKLDVPGDLIKKLPKLSQDGYKGASNRVWNKVRESFVVDDQGKRKKAKKTKVAQAKQEGKTNN